MDSTPVRLTQFQRTVLWHISQGYTVPGAAAEIGVNRSAVIDSLILIRRKLNTATTPQAVLRGYLDGHIGAKPDCGTRSSYVRHTRLDEDVCPACRNANAEWVDQKSRPGPPVQPLTQAQVKIIRAFQCGRSHADLMQSWGVSRNQLHRAVTDMYRRLGVAGVPRDERREKALEEARLRGLLLPGKPRKLPPARGAVVGLTRRETEILAAVASGCPLADAVPVLGIPTPTICSRLSEIYRKLDVSHLPRRDKRTAAVRAARAQGYAL